MEKEYLSLEALLAVILLVIYVISAPIFEKIHFHYIHESGLVMLMGIAITLTFKFFIPSLDFTTSLAFSDKIFFTYVLPLVIFGAGYNLKKRKFFKYFIYIFLLGVIGTLIVFVWVAPVTYFFNKFNFFYLSYSKYDYPSLIKMGGVPVDPVTKRRLNISELNLTNDKTINSMKKNFTIYNNSFNHYNIMKNKSELLRYIQEECSSMRSRTSRTLKKSSTDSAKKRIIPSSSPAPTPTSSAANWRQNSQAVTLSLNFSR